jgi:periplasmic protein TonB
VKRGRVLDAARWGLCFALVLFFHVAGAVALMARWSGDDDLVANAPVIMIDLAPVPVAAQTQPNELPPDVVESNIAEPEPEPLQEKPLIEVPQQQNAELPVMPPPKPVEKPKQKPKQRHASVASAPSTAEQKADRAAGPAPGASSRNPSALPNWKSALVAQLERHKRYPSDANGASGVSQLAFSVDRRGGVHNARIVRSSGSSALDHATLALIGRAQPLPPPPPEIQGAQIAITVPIHYSMR